jgi:trimethylamine:corrinoid methyltransferase-like protein
MREIYMSEFMDRRPYAEWESKKDDARDWALAKARRILAEHRPEPLDARLSAEFERMINVAESPTQSSRHLPAVAGRAQVEPNAT